MKQAALDAVHFSTRPWHWRVAEWLRRARADGGPVPFLDGNVATIRAMLSDAAGGLRMVVNIGPHALRSFLRSGRYLNVYEKATVGGAPPGDVPPERIEVDTLLGIDAPRTWFGALAFGGAGVRYYGCYCMAMQPERMPPATGLFDRDSYELLAPPLAGRSPARLRLVVRALRGAWHADAVEMLLLKLLPRLPRGQQHLLTVGHVSRLVLSDQEFVEVHRPAPITRADLAEVRQSAADMALEADIRARSRRGHTPGLVELQWLESRDRVADELRSRGIRARIAAHPGQGEPWQ
jgi:hypothetical protein